jgi:2'-5' RNA ligase
MSEAWRLFIALELPPDVLKAITRVQSRFEDMLPERAIRWVRPQGIHLTLKFLGDAPPEQLDDLNAALVGAAAGRQAFRLGVEGVGCFPNTQRPRVMWLGVVGDLKPLRALQAGVEEHIAPLGYPPDKRGFSPHLTLGRARRNAGRDALATVGQLVETEEVGRLADWQVTSVSLIRSQLKPGGAVYTQVGEAGLETPGG